MLKKRLGTEAIERNWWSNKNLTNTNYFKIPSTLIIPDGCERIGKCTFWDCWVRKVVIPRSVKNIRECAFYCCVKLKKVVISDGCEGIEDKAFQWCEEMKEVIIPGSVKMIGEFAFCGCENATIILEKPRSKFKKIGRNAFEDCKDVKEKTGN